MRPIEYYGHLAETRGTSAFAIGTRHWEALQRLGSGHALLDIGCGAGDVLREASFRYREVHGVDIALSPLLDPRAANCTVQRVDLDAGPLPYAEGYFDRVICLDVIEHIFDPLHLVRESYRVLRSGGTAVYSTPNIRSLRCLAMLSLRGRFPRTSNETYGYDGGHLHYFTSGDLRDLFEQVGFVGVRVSGILTPGGRARALKRLLFPLRDARPVREFIAGGLILQAVRAGERE